MANAQQEGEGKSLEEITSQDSGKNPVNASRLAAGFLYDAYSILAGIVAGYGLFVMSVQKYAGNPVMDGIYTKIGLTENVLPSIPDAVLLSYMVAQKYPDTALAGVLFGAAMFALLSSQRDNFGRLVQESLTPSSTISTDEVENNG